MNGSFHIRLAVLVDLFQMIDQCGPADFQQISRQ